VVHEDVEMSLGDHLVELRKRVLRGLLGVLAATIAAGIFYKEIMQFVLVPYSAGWNKSLGWIGLDPSTIPQPHIIMGGPITGIMSIIIVTTVVGVFVASPWVLYQLWSFVSVGLRERERRYVRIYAPISFLMFLGGGAVCYIMLPFLLAGMMYMTLQIQMEPGIPLIDPSVLLAEYLKIIALLVLIFGIMFEIPLVIVFLTRSGLVSVQTLARKQKVIIFILIVVGSILAPSGDPMSCGVIAGMLIALYEIGLLASWLLDIRARRRKAREEAAENSGGGEGPRD
jgi:sec-independent protein translocase protein TatC